MTKTFSELNIVPQYKVIHDQSIYYIDFYFPDKTIAIEVDEFGHKDRNQEEEFERQAYIEEKLECTFIRCNPDDKDFDIFCLLHEIRMLLNE